MGGYNLQKLNVLVVDDNKHTRQLVKAILRALGVNYVYESADGEQALAELEIARPDIVICDLVMAPMDGLEFVRAVRTGENSPNPYLPIIMLTGHTEMHRIKEAVAAGVNELLAKPISPAALYRRLGEIIENARPFVRTETYFGPDRRRFDDPKYSGPERRADRTNAREVASGDASAGRQRMAGS